jgi:hypothetical protein
VTAFTPKHYPRTKLPSGRVLTDAQQHQYDVLRTVGGKLVQDKDGWWREHSPTHRERVRGLNAIAMWSLVGYGLAEAIGSCDRGAAQAPATLVFAVPAIAKEIEGQRYERVGQIVRECP